jgi:Na+/melibiose symporter-like transporter
MLAFTKGVLDHFGYTKIVYQLLNFILFIGVLSWLVYLNISFLGSKQAFTPVIVYAVLGMLVLGVPHFIGNLKKSKRASLYILMGILLMAISAVIFKAIPAGEGIKPSDVSHIFIALSLASLTRGFIKIKSNEN